MSCLKNANELYQMMGQGQTMDAFEKFYAEDVKVWEPTGECREGKEAQRAAIQQWQAGIKEFHSGGVNSITANEETGVSCVESWTDITTQDGNRWKLEEVAVQKWKDNQIVNERFYYNVPAGMEAPKKA